jgi:hypothetical protein
MLVGSGSCPALNPHGKFLILFLLKKKSKNKLTSVKHTISPKFSPNFSLLPHPTDSHRPPPIGVPPTSVRLPTSDHECRPPYSLSLWLATVDFCYFFFSLHRVTIDGRRGGGVWLCDFGLFWGFRLGGWPNGRMRFFFERKCVVNCLDGRGFASKWFSLYLYACIWILCFNFAR